MPRVPEPESWGARLREAREAEGWRQGDLGEHLGGVTYFTISAWELGDSTPTAANVEALSRLGGEFSRLAEERRAPDGLTLTAVMAALDRIEAGQVALAATVDRMADLVESNERRIAALEGLRAGRAARGG